MPFDVNLGKINESNGLLKNSILSIDRFSKWLIPSVRFPRSIFKEQNSRDGWNTLIFLVKSNMALYLIFPLRSLEL